MKNERMINGSTDEQMNTPCLSVLFKESNGEPPQGTSSGSLQLSEVQAVGFPRSFPLPLHVIWKLTLQYFYETSRDRKQASEQAHGPLTNQGVVSLEDKAKGSDHNTDFGLLANIK